jgi:hypothetical protein
MSRLGKPAPATSVATAIRREDAEAPYQGERGLSQTPAWPLVGRTEAQMKRFRFVLLAVVALVVGVLTTASFASPLRHHARAKTGLTIRWDLISFNGNFANPINPGGSASAHAPDGTKITLTGSGTFGGPAKKVTGGGNWTTYDASGAQSGTGTYKVVSLVSFIEANPQSQTPVATDSIGDVNKRANGTAVLRVAFSDGSQGVLTIG